MSELKTPQTSKLFGWNTRSFLEKSRGLCDASAAELVYCGTQAAAQSFLESKRQEVPAWMFATMKLEDGDLWVLPLAERPVILLKPKALTSAQKRDGGQLTPSPYSQARDLCGRAWAELRRLKVEQFRLSFREASSSMQLGALVGLDLAAYSYKSAIGSRNGGRSKVELDVEMSIFAQAIAIARGTNIARHLVNTPPNQLYPESFAAQVAELFSGKAGLSVDIWDFQRLQREGMGLHLAVGMGAEHRPCLLHIRYRPEETTKQAPIALIGKGVTFDSGGLDIKDQAGMRLMKKDMGGAATVVGVLSSLVEHGPQRPLDIYIPLAENAISERAYRPGDVIRSKSGLTVEIHNTDAEGRLILADSIAVAAAQKGADKPAAIIVAATLTGAIKVGLGADVAGLFSNDERVAGSLQKAAQEFGDPLWRMPLYEAYRSKLDTNVADINHCATGSYGGAITAALFLVEFSQGHPFAHLDIYAWADGERGAVREVGGSGQAVQSLISFLSQYQT